MPPSPFHWRGSFAPHPPAVSLAVARSPDPGYRIVNRRGYPGWLPGSWLASPRYLVVEQYPTAAQTWTVATCPGGRFGLDKPTEWPDLAEVARWLGTLPKWAVEFLDEAGWGVEGSGGSRVRLSDVVGGGARAGAPVALGVPA